MRVGTKSVIFGVHQFIIHPILVAKAWRLLYEVSPSIREWACIVTHDLGYLGCRDMDGEDGVLHPFLGAWIMAALFGAEEQNLALLHSRKIAKILGRPESKLCAPDKISILLYPTWLYLLLGRASGEIQEYKQRMNMPHLDDLEWLEATRQQAYAWTVSNVSLAGQRRLLARFPGVRKNSHVEEAAP